MNERKAPRIPFRVKASVSFDDKTIEGDIDNLSTGGMFLLTREPFQPDAKVNITIFLSGSSSHLSLKLAGRVVHSKDEGSGFQFLEMDFDSFVHLRNIMKYNQTDESLIVKEFEEANIDMSVHD